MSSFAMSTHHQIIYCTCPDKEAAKKLAQGLVENHLAACVNIIPGLTSVYPWQGKIETANEVLLLIKTHNECFPALENYIQTHHPYELPEIVAVPIEQGAKQYLNWVSEWVDTSH